MEALKGLFRCSCRRRNVLQKLFPAVLQVFVVIGVWQIFKSQMQTDSNGEDWSPNRNLRSADQPLCSPGDYSKGKKLRLDAIVSQAEAMLGIDDQQVQPSGVFLSVEVIVRDAEHGSLILYPVGTPVIPQGDLVADPDVDYIEYNIDNIVEKGHDDGNEDIPEQQDEGEENAELLEAERAQADYGDSGNELAEGQNRQLILDYGNGNVRDADYPQVGHDGQGERQILDQMIVQDQMIPLNPEVQQEQPQGPNSNAQIGNVPSQLGQMMGNNFNPTGQNIQTAPLHRNVQPNGMAESAQNPSVTVGRNARLGQSYSGQNIQQMKMQADALNPGSNNQAPPENAIRDQRLLYQKSVQSGIHQGVQPTNNMQGGALNTGNLVIPAQNYGTTRNHQPGFGSEQNPNPAKLQSASSLGYNLVIDDSSEPLYTDGFSDRVKKFKSELYGKVPDETSDGVKSPNIFHINNPNACRTSEKIDLLFVINSLPQSDESRQRIRNTFADSSSFPSFTVVHMFLVGKTISPNFQNNLNQEQQKYGDILQGEFLDTPENTTLKGLMGMRWVIQFCRSTKFVMKIDEDVFVDTDKLLRGLIPAAEKIVGQKAIFCSFTPEGPIPRTGPNAIARDLFPTRTHHRPYCKGFAILMTRGVISSLLASAEHVPIFHATDLYLYGILPFVAGGIEVYDVGNKRAFHNFGMEVLNCYKDQKDQCPFVASIAFSDRFTALWEMVRTRLQESPVPQWEGEQSLWNFKSFRRNF